MTSFLALAIIYLILTRILIHIFFIPISHSFSIKVTFIDTVNNFLIAGYAFALIVLILFLIASILTFLLLSTFSLPHCYCSYMLWLKKSASFLRFLILSLSPEILPFNTTICFNITKNLISQLSSKL